ncbi:MAG: chalcone isomerase [Moraxellaceae bacterium]|nr:MAG: chalcone isomerase [Moraxellaceae bacterium]
MRKISTLIFALLISMQLSAMEIGGIDMPNTMTGEGYTLELNGAGIRDKFFMEVYVGGLYLKNKTNNAPDIINANEPMAIRLHITSNIITSKRMRNASIEGFDNALDGIKDESLQTKINSFLATYTEKIKKGDIFEMIYTPNKGVDIFKNTVFITTIDGFSFKKALFGIWLCNTPPQKSLKKGMLGD